MRGVANVARVQYISNSLVFEHYEEVEIWKYYLVEKLIQFKRLDVAFDVFSTAEVDQSGLDVGEQVVDIYLQLDKYLQCYDYVHNHKDMKPLFRYFLKQSFEVGKRTDLFKLELTDDQELILEQFLKKQRDTNNAIYQTHFIVFLLNREKYRKAIHYYQQVWQFNTQESLEEARQVTPTYPLSPEDHRRHRRPAQDQVPAVHPRLPLSQNQPDGGRRQPRILQSLPLRGR